MSVLVLCIPCTVQDIVPPKCSWSVGQGIVEGRVTILQHSEYMVMEGIKVHLLALATVEAKGYVSEYVSSPTCHSLWFM